MLRVCAKAGLALGSVAVTTSAYEPGVAALVALIRNVLTPVPAASVAGEKEVETPVGTPDTLRIRLLANFPCAFPHTSFVLVAWLCRTVTEAGIAVRVQLVETTTTRLKLAVLVWPPAAAVTVIG